MQQANISYQLVPDESCTDSFDAVLDRIVYLLNTYMSENQIVNSPFLFVIRGNAIHSVKILKKELFANIFEELILQLNLHYKTIPVNLTIQSLIDLYQDLLQNVGSAASIANDIMLEQGGSTFPMFPPCIGYVLARQHENLFCVQPSEMYEIDDNAFKKYILTTLNNRFT